jgi:phosphopantetheinyl transferase
MKKILYKQLNIEAFSAKERRQAEHDCVYALLEKELSLFGRSIREVIKDENGKPFIPGNEIYFSLAHASGLCVCAICDRAVGVDAEALRPKDKDSLLRLAQRYFTSGEKTRLENAGDSLSEAFLSVWVKKESIVKRSGIGIAGMKGADSEGADLHFFSLPGYVLSLCTDADGPLEIIESTD